MQADQAPYSQFNLVRDMLAAADAIAAFDPGVVKATAAEIAAVGKLLFTGEGSSRLFPAKNAIRHARQQGWKTTLHTEAGRQSQDYALADWAVLGMSNSGRTAEVIRLFTRLKEAGNPHRYSLAATPGSALEVLAARGHVLSCGKEGAVAATKSVVEQALFCRALVEAIAGQATLAPRLAKLAEQFRTALRMPIDAALTRKISGAGTIYFAGRNDGVAEELTLKTNEITRQRSDYLEGTYAVHGIEEIMQADDVVLWIDPYPESEQKFHEVLVKGVGLTVIAISSRPTMFPTVTIPDAGDLSGFVELAAGWNLLVEAGMHRGINVDKPQRARKVGNEIPDRVDPLRPSAAGSQMLKSEISSRSKRGVIKAMPTARPEFNSLASGSCTFLLLALTATCGCSSAPATHPVTGKVIWQGGGDAKELVGHTVTFESEDGKTSGSGTIQADGTFTIGTFGEKDGALAGRHRVVLTPPELPEDTFPPPPLIPRRYGSFENSGLTVEVKPEKNSVLLEVERSAR